MSIILSTKAAMDVAQAVDRYRHQNYADEQILKHYTSRKDMEKALYDFYRRQGIDDVSPELIGAVIEEHERKRFTHQLPKMSLLKRVIAQSYISLRHIDYSFCILGVLGVTLACIPVFMLLSSNTLEPVSIPADSESHVIGRLVISKEDHQRLIEQGQQLIEVVNTLSTTLQNETHNAAHHAVNTLLPTLLANKERIADLIDPTLVSDRFELDRLITETEVHIERFNALREVGDQYLDMQASTKFDDFMQYSSMKNLNAQLHMAFASVNAEHASKNMTAMIALMEGIERSKAMMDAIDQQVAASREAFKDKAGVDRLDRLVERARTATENGDVQAMQAVSAQVLALYKFVGSKLTVRIQDEPGKPSVFYREKVDIFGSGINDGRRYFVVLEMVDEDGVVYSVDVPDVESRATRTVAQWGQQITKATYELIRDDKIANKQVTEREYGIKERGYYDHILTRPFLKNAITQW